MESFQDIEHFVKTLSAAIKKKIPTKVSQLTNDAGYKTTDTTYKLSKSGSTVTLTGSDGSTTSVTDSNTTYSSLKNPYSLDIQNNGSTVASYDGSAAKTVNLTNATASSNGLMSASDKSKLDGIDPSAITTKYGIATSSTDGLMSKSDKAKLDGISSAAGSNVVATESTDGLMSAADKTKLDGIDPSAITTNAANIKKNADAIDAMGNTLEGRVNALSADLAKQNDNINSNTSAISTLNSNLTRYLFIENVSAYKPIFHYGVSCDRESTTTITIDFGSVPWDNMTALIFTRYALVGFQVTVYQTGVVTNHTISNIVGGAPFSATHSDSKVTLTVNAWETFEMLFTLHGNVLPTFTVS